MKATIIRPPKCQHWSARLEIGELVVDDEGFETYAPDGHPVEGSTLEIAAAALRAAGIEIEERVEYRPGLVKISMTQKGFARMLRRNRDQIHEMMARTHGAWSLFDSPSIS